MVVRRLHSMKVDDLGAASPFLDALTAVARPIGNPRADAGVLLQDPNPSQK